MIKEILLAAAGASGFALLFGLEFKKVWVVTVSSAVSWLLYIVIGNLTDSKILAMFIVTLLAGILSEIISMVWKCPAMIFLTPILIPFIPGATLYRVMYDIINKEPQLVDEFTWLMMQVGAIAFGIMAVEIIVEMINSVCKYKL